MESTSTKSGASSSTSGSVENVATKCDDLEYNTKKVDNEELDNSDQPGPSTSAGAEGGQVPAIDPLFQQQKKDLVFELRRLKLGDRPVTGQGNREAVEEFFNRRYNVSENAEPEPQERPQEVVVEVQGLVERRCVSSLLHSLQFRQRLEGAIRSSFATLTNERNPRPSNVATRSQSPQSSATDESPAGATAANPSSISSAIPVASNEPAPTERAASWLQQHVPVPPAAPSADVGNGPAAFNFEEDLHDMYREHVIQEISELVQQQLVTQTLSGNFREVLETRVLADRVGENGPRVQEFIQTLPRGQVMRNDFSNLNLPGAFPLAADALSDTVSVISATAAVQVSQSQTNTAVMRELNSVKAQMLDLQNMMRKSFSLQLDLQRAIRQEVSAALAQVTGDPTTANLERRHRPVNDSKCVICVENSADTVMYKCGHLCTCYSCGMTLKSRGHHCPMCRAPIQDIIRAYKANLD